MLIKSLTAHNFRKYHHLEVSDIPENGVITIAGENESGKTSIGEAICFALFGRTFFLDEKNIHKIVCWGRDQAEVNLTFSVNDNSVDKNENYHLYRNLQRDGTSDVSLKKGESEESELNTLEDVTEALSKILGFDYDAFSNSFYLVQRELTTPDPHSASIKQMAGISDYATITDELNEASKEEEAKIAELTPQMKSTQAELDEINLDEEWLSELIDAEQTLGDEKKQRLSLASNLTDSEASYADNVDSFKEADKTSRLWKGLSRLALVVMVVSGVIWALKSYKPVIFEEILIQLRGIDELPSILSSLNTFLLPFFIVSIISFIISYYIRSKANTTMKVLADESAVFSSNLTSGREAITKPVNTLLPERVVKSINEREDTDTVITIPDEEKFANLNQLIDELPTYQADPEEINATVLRLTGSLEKQDEEMSSVGTQLLKDIDEERVRSDAAGKLRAALKVLTRKFDKCNYNISVHDTSKEMLKRAAKDSIGLFNTNIAETSAKTLPHFTEGRYCEVKIADDLSVQVHSDEKDGFMDFDEISSGTQRQVMLALRLAMSEELAKNTGNEKQFIFLDEPFAFFDQHRTRSTLQALPGISKVISQIWIVAQEFPDEVEVNKAIICPSDRAKLLV